MGFRTGDKVCLKYMYKNWGEGKIIGTTATMYCVEFNENISGHNGNNMIDFTTRKIIKGKTGHCWYVFKEDLKLISKANVNRRIMK